jgi:hypothetical protein
MKGKLLLLAGAAAGYVLGTKAGRERYEQIKRTAGRMKDDPRVQEKAHRAADLAREKAPLVAEKLSDAVPGTHHGTDSGPTSGAAPGTTPGPTPQEDSFRSRDLP